MAASLAVFVGRAHAEFTVNLKASAVDPSLGTLSLDGKTIQVTGTSGNVTLQIWAQVTNAAPTNNIFGVARLLGNIVSASSNPTGASGSLSPATSASPFNVGSTGGIVTELSVIPDGILDLGTSSTVSTVNAALFAKNIGSGGEQIGSVSYATNNQPAGATVNTITNGYEFLMGTASLSVTDFEQGPVEMNWFFPNFTTVANRSFRAAWTQGDGLNDNGLNQLAVGTPVVMVPEPSGMMLLLGGAALFGWRRRW